ncbi:SMP-30/gluconolactonase/LRE family protein [Dysgonomonas sp. Marseille-P4677]|uniref:SMP-30/gluconolactonase/LRE family protein n=1 Tax=Dysgonomonas sp. Marseille-P4677 TaxID=2364790 RepID=UPI0019124A78|nr:SMP-30/gluconolactonase/LRE family protein [Dysgonomonas sp. Marseille-P4677]MBK5721988.1 SMP-30/gluconolactonase/LRE family protein [Dysgonomonas sp. Marseille-P4677]
MNKFQVSLNCFLLVLTFNCHSQNKSNIIASGAKVEKLADGFSFTEGPAVDKEGNVYFTDQPNNLILKWSTEGELTTFHKDPGRANGLYFDLDGYLLSCSDAENELWSIDIEGNHKILISDFEGAKLNGPNDLWVHPSGGIYFTDPLYKRNYWTRNPEMQQPGEYVYYLAPDREKLIRVETDLKKPNGIIGTPDGKRLYVADIGADETYVYDIKKDGTLSNKKLFTSLGSDGMTIDSMGNIYLTGKGVSVFNPQGEQIEHIPIEANWTANICFGGKDMKTLFITASQYLYSLQMNVGGAR